ncbi:tetratricopeptide repeat protein [Magnetospirillum sp. SS-4]|uniref:tetratricopeptide repeat protein n=1 Tax=Magnetospirillum sp. SS-4 TaxID=2681465 RepID=UPI00137CF3DA|nr:tetratricopeptide repeat protein [Magnetospirillum sp. SS-4]CAA7616158.1 TPR repeat [Magnetospirillum sp. SS-4]
MTPCRAVTTLGSVLLAAWLLLTPAWAEPADDLIAKSGQAMRAGQAEEVMRLGAEISKLRDAMPAWVAERQQAASAVPQAKQRAAMLWNRAHQQAIASAGGGDLAKATGEAAQALSIARDNLGEGHLATIISATDLAALQNLGGQIEAAEASFLTALKMAQAALGEGHPETLKIAQALAEFHQSQARFDPAVTVYQAAAKAAAAALGAAHPQTLSLQLAVVRAQINASRTKEAGALLDSACAAARKTYGPAHAEFSRCLALQGQFKRQMGEFNAAAGLYDQALAIQKLAVPPTHPLSLATRMDAGGVYHRQGRLAEAQAMLEGVVKDAGTTSDTASQLSAKGDLADVLDDRGDYAAAEAMAREVLEQQTARLGAAHPNTVAALSSLASIYRKQGRLVEAEKAFQDAWERYRKILGENHRSTVIAANNLGEILEKEGIYERAEPFLRGALEGSRKSFGETHPTTMTTMNNLALLYESQGVFDKAEPLYQSVIAVFSKTIGPKHPDTIASTNNLAYLYMLKGEYDRAAAMFRQVHEAWVKAYGPRHQNTLKALNNLARATHRLGKLKEAEPLFNQALAARRAVLGETHIDTLRSMHDLAALHRSAKRLKEAEDLLRKTLALNESVLGPAHPYTFETLNTLAAVQEDKGDAKAAAETRKTTFTRRTDFLNRVLYVTGDNAREGYVRLHSPELASYVAALSRLDESAAGRALLEVSLNRKGLLLKVASEIQQITRLSRDPELTRMTEELAEARKRLAALTLSGPTEETKNNHIEVVNKLEEDIDTLQGNLGRASARFQRTVKSIAVDDLVKALPDDAVLVDFFIHGEDGQQKLVAGVLRKDAGVPVFGLVKFDSLAAIDAAILKYRAEIQNEDVDFDDLLDIGEEVHKLVWQPLERLLGGRAKVYVVPDGSLNILPIAAMVEKNRKYLIERVDLHVLNSTRDLLPSPVKAASGGYMINAGPDYNTEEVVGKETLEKARSRSANPDVMNAVRGMSSGMRGLKFDPLPGAEKEGQLIQKTVEGQGKATTIYSKGAAQEKVLREMSQPPEVLHIATHGFFLKADDTLRKRLLKLQRSSDFSFPPPGDNPLLRAGLAFAGINSNAGVLGEIDTDNDGVLTALEVLGLDLAGTRLAILSACETGLGEVHEGEGVYGLRRAFQEAGVQSVVSSLWEVSDAGTQTLMAALYKRLLAGKTPHDALREAQLEMLRNPQWSMPYIWSAFFMVGG